MRGRAHGEEVRAQAMAALLAGQGITDVARAYDLPESSVRTWKERIPDAEFALVRAKKGEQIEQLLFSYLTQLLTTLERQAVIAGEREYITKQPAGELAVLHGVMADKGIRLLEAAHRAGQPKPNVDAAAVPEPAGDIRPSGAV